jgi:hypothetical protein
MCQERGSSEVLKQAAHCMTVHSMIASAVSYWLLLLPTLLLLLAAAAAAVAAAAAAAASAAQLATDATLDLNNRVLGGPRTFYILL